jgi:uncharacterized protein YjgD (DUF1641 family)
MAQPISVERPIRDPRAELLARLEQAPAEHADALLEAYEVLQGLHEGGVFEILRGALGSKEKVLDVAVGAATAPASMRAMRNSLLLLNLLAAIDPVVLRRFTEAVPRALNTMVRKPERPGLWALIKDFLWNQDFRHGMASLNTLIEELGRGLSGGKPPAEMHGNAGAAEPRRRTPHHRDA